MESFRRVAVVLSTFSEPGRAVLRGVARYAEHKGNWELHTSVLPMVDPEVLRLALHADAVIALLLTDENAAILQQRNLPVVGVHYAGALPIPRVSDDNRRIVEMAVEHFESQGFRTFAFFGAEAKQFSIDRWECVSKALAARGFTCHRYDSPKIHSHSFGFRGYDEDLGQWLRSLPKPVGLLAANDALGLMLMVNARHVGVRIPDDVAVVGIDNDELICRVTSPQLSSIDPNGQQIGYEAAAMVDRQFNGETISAETRYVEPAKLVVRQSSDVIAVRDPDVSSAVRFIRQNTAKNLSVEDVVREIAVARRTLERGFRVSLGRSIYDEIAESRVRLARKLLMETDLGISEITAACGFKYRTHLNTVFRKRAGHSPAAFRKIFRMERP